MNKKRLKFFIFRYIYKQTPGVKFSVTNKCLFLAISPFKLSNLLKYLCFLHNTWTYKSDGFLGMAVFPDIMVMPFPHHLLSLFLFP